MPTQFVGELVDRGTRRRLAGYRVHAVDRVARGRSIDLGSSLTDVDGLFTFVYPAAADGQVLKGHRRLSLKVIDPTGQQVAAARVDVSLGRKKPLRVAVAIANAADRRVTVDELAGGARLKLPPRLRRTLRQSGIRTVVDVLKKGLAARLDGAPAAVRRSARRLEAHANLHSLSSDARLNARLIAGGYSSIDAIARSSRTTFVEAVRERLGEPAAGRLWAEARGQNLALTNAIVQARTAVVYGQVAPVVAPKVVAESPLKCGCEDCEAAVSPLAYLADLLDYTLLHVTRRGAPIDLQFLTDTFHQPFGELPATCEAMDEQVRQVRLCIEVLRRHFNQRIIAGRFRLAALRRAEREYRRSAYTSLLRAIGTSFEEIRLAHQLDPVREDEAARLRQLHDRIAVDLDDRQPKAIVDALRLDPSNPASLTEAKLEELFGLVDTNRNPLDAVANARVPRMEAWRLQHLRTLWRQQDWPDDGPGEGRPLIDPDVIGPDDLRWPFPKANVRQPDGPFDLWVQRRRLIDDTLIRYRTEHEAQGLEHILKAALGDPLPDLDGLLARANAGADPAQVAQEIEQLGLTTQGFTRLMAIRDKDQRAARDPRSPGVDPAEWHELYSILTQVEKVRLFPRWQREERPIEFGPKNFWVSLRDPQEGTWPPPSVLPQPFVDPERVTADALARARPGRAAARLRETRERALEQLRHDLQVEREANGFDAMVALALGHPQPGDPPEHDLAAVARELNDARAAVAERARRKLTRDLHLTIQTFTQLVDAGVRAGAPNPQDRPTAAEWQQVYASLATARTLKHEYPEWIAEEARLPLIDPDALTEQGLAEPVIGQRAIDLWRARRDEIERVARALEDARVAGGFDAMLRAALGHPNPGDPPQYDIAQLAVDLESANPATAERARRRITRDLRLTLDTFLLLVATALKDANPDPLKRPADAEWIQVAAILTQARKEKHLFAGWAREERREGFDTDHWRALKAALPRWLGPLEARDRWQQALRIRSGPPLVDPDLTGPGDLRAPVAGNPAYDIWQRRYDWLHDPDPAAGQLAMLAATRQTPPRRLAGLDAVLEAALGVPAADLVALADQREQGTSIARRLDQLSLPADAFSYLIRARNLVARGEQLLDSEWGEVDSILAAVLKRREHAAWRDEEEAAGLSLNPDHFKIPPQIVGGRPVDPEPLPAWRADARARREWQGVLESRIEQDAAVRQALRDAVAVAEDAALPALRDALVVAAGAPGSTLDEMAAWVTNHLLIDARTGACHRTPRIEQAIETLQGLLWRLRTGQWVPRVGQARDVYSDLELSAPDFDDEWNWIGSYASWRAAMFVFLYPENVLIPTLRNWQTPAFRRLVSDLRSANRVTPDLACRAARSYEAYYRDVCHLFVEASCRARTRVREGGCRDKADGGERELFYMFARGEASHALYWSAYDANDDTPYAQTFWQAAGGFPSIVRLIGAVPYDRQLDERFLFLFAIVQDGGQEKLAFLKYHLEQQVWDAEPTLLEELPEDATAFSAVVKQHHRPADPPHLAIRVPSGAIYDRHLNREGSDWEDAAARLVVDAAHGAGFTSLHAMVESGERNFCLFVTDRAGRVKYAEYREASLVTRGRRPAALRTAAHRSRLHAFVRGEDDGLWYAWRQDDGQQGAWRSLAGGLTSDPVVVAGAQYSYGLHVFALGARSALVHLGSDSDGNRWTNLENLGGSWTSPPGAASWPDGRLHVFVRGAGDTLYHRRRDQALVWHEAPLPDPLGGAGPLAPAAIAWDNARNPPDNFFITLFVVSADGTLQQLSYEEARGGWDQAWVVLDQGPWDSSPAVASYNPAQVALFLRRTDLTLAHLNQFGVGGGWQQQSWGGLLNSDPAAVGWREPRGTDPDRYLIEVLAKGADGNVSLGRYDRIGNLRTDPSFWSGFTESLGAEVAQGQALVWRELGTGTWLGAFQWANSDDSYAFWRDEASATRYVAIPAGQAPQGPWTAGPQLGAIAIHAGGSLRDDDTLIAYLRRDPRVPYRYRSSFRQSGPQLTEQDTIPVAPLVPNWPFFANLFTLTERMTADELLRRRQQLERLSVYAAAASWPESIQVYFDEAHYFVPVYLAMQLQRQGHYVPALDWFRTVYDYSVPVERRKIPHGLVREEGPNVAYRRPDTWLLDPLNPHAIATARTNTYTRFTITSLVRCFLDYADAEFTRDTPESVARARTLYMTARALLDLEALKVQTDMCSDRIGTLPIELASANVTVESSWLPVLRDVQRQLSRIDDRARLHATIDRITRVLAREDRPWAARFAAARALIADEIGNRGKPTVAGVRANGQAQLARAHTLLLADRSMAEAVARAGLVAGRQFARRTGVQGAAGGAAVAPNQQPGVKNSFVPSVSYSFCIPLNPLLQGLRLHAELNLFKIRTCRNIAGMERELEPYAAPTDTRSGLPVIGASENLVLPGVAALRPTLYRYSTLVERAKQLAHLAGQIESAMLAALEKRDAEYYSLTKTRQDVQLARADVVLQDLRVKEAEDGVGLAHLQQQRAQIEAAHFDELLEENLTTLEELAIGLMVASGILQLGASGLYGAAAVTLDSGSSSSRLSSLGASASALAGAVSTAASIASTYASYERRRQEWEFHRSLAEQDVLIGGQQIALAEDRVRVAGQERRIAAIRQDHAKDNAEFLATKFTNVELYDWMSDVLEGVYSFFLQQATAAAKVAEQQLAFERQETSASFIQADYWEAPRGANLGGDGNGAGPDRRGLTGSARLLRDLTQLDQFAFETRQRKQQISKTLSLARLAPAEFQRFRETGVMSFRTPMRLFDRDHPGDYLRLIQRVRTSVFALIPPPQEIRATLATTGTARTVVGGPVFQAVRTNYGPQSVALSSPREATGTFELQPPSEMLLPFEGLGVDTTWELRMPKPSNLLDYSTIADVFLTIDYTALSSVEYREQIIRELDRDFSADRPFSFRHQFADRWYDLNNADRTATPMQVRFQTRRSDFPPGLDDLRVQHVLLYFVAGEGRTLEGPPVRLRFSEQGSRSFVGGDAAPLDRVVSTRRGNAGSWTPMIGRSPIGAWELALPNTPEVRSRFTAGDVEDLLFVITYAGRTPAWPG